MAKTAYVRARIEPEIKAEFDALLEKLGLSMSDAIGLFFRWSIREKRVPADARVPNAGLRRTISDARAGRGLKSFTSTAEMRAYYEKRFK